MSPKNEFNQPIGDEVKNWQPAKKYFKETIQRKFCILEKLNPDKHSEYLFKIYDQKGWTYLPYGPFESIDEFRHWLVNTPVNDDPFFYVILDIKTKLPIGIAAYLRIMPEHGVIEVGHLHFSPILKKTPAATEAMYLMMLEAFENLGYRRYEWKCDSLNEASRKAAERLGFKFEGIFRQHWVYKNRSRDTAWFSIIDKEWPELKRRFQQWLDPNNFDEKGNQKLSLREI